MITVENACASGTTAFLEAHEAVRTGRYGRVLALGLEQMSTAFDGADHPGADRRRGALRAGHAGALRDGRRTATCTTGRRHARAAGRGVGEEPRGTPCTTRAPSTPGDYTVEQVLASRMIADPLTLLQCCPTSDGAAAAVLAPGRRRRRARSRVRGLALPRPARCGTTAPPTSGATTWCADTAADAYAAAGLGAATTSTSFEVHDAFTIGEIVTTEALGHRPARATAARPPRPAVTALGGALPVNPSGGLLSRGHPLGATGLAQVAEVVWQLRGRGRRPPGRGRPDRPGGDDGRRGAAASTATPASSRCWAA